MYVCGLIVRFRVALPLGCLVLGEGWGVADFIVFKETVGWGLEKGAIKYCERAFPFGTESIYVLSHFWSPMSCGCETV